LVTKLTKGKLYENTKLCSFEEAMYIWTALDEAKKEFPNINDPKYEYDYQIYNDMVKWFERWFGDSDG
jgi:hypothetical protein